jgi:Transposase DDE domain/Transposase domain (DUF772)
MFRPTTAQTSMLAPSLLLPPAKVDRLKASWAHDFRERVLPRIDEEPLRDAFCRDNGRPNTSIRLLMGLSLLKEMFDLTDDEALANLEFNLQWQYALGVSPEEAHVSQRTLHSFRVRLTENARAAQMFDSLILEIIRHENIRVNSQRLDSTHVQSNIATLTRLSLFTETLTTFLRDLQTHLPAKLNPILPQFLAQYLGREGYFSDVKQNEARRRLPMVAQHVADLVRHFQADEEVNIRETYGVLCRLLNDQCDLTPAVSQGTESPAAPTSGEPSSQASGDGEDVSKTSASPSGSGPLVATPKDPKTISGASLQSPHDPDATYGHKGKGYQVQIAETCDPNNPFQVVLGFELTAANASDQREVIPMLDRLAKNGVAPEVLYADQGYGCGRNIVEADQRGVDLHAPVGGTPNQKTEKTLVGMGLVEDLAPGSLLDQEEQGQPNAPVGQGTQTPQETEQVPENENVAIGCAEGAAESPRKESAASATRRRQQEQQQPEFREAYKIRSGIESTNRALKHRHGAKSMRVRGRGRMECALRLKVLALNTVRLVQFHESRRRKMR